MASLTDIVTKDSTNRSVILRIIDSTDGTPETGVVWNTAGIDLWYRREGAAVTSVTEATLASLTTAHADGGFLHVSDGEYRFDLPDAAFATGAESVDFGGTVTGMVVIGGRVRLTDLDLETAMRGTDSAALATALATAQTDLDTITGTNGAIIAPAQGPVTFTGTGNAAGLTLQGDGTGAGLAAFGGLTGAGILGTGGGTSGDGLTLTADGSGVSNADLDAILTDTGTTIPGTITTMQNDLDIITDSDGVILGAAGIDLVWDEVITKAAHDVANSAAKYVRQTKQSTVGIDSAVDDPGAAATTTVFNTDLTEADDFWNDSLIVFTTGSLANQSRPILDYANTNGQITLDEPLTSAPADNDEFIIKAYHTHPVSQIADGVWDEPTSGHTTAGTTGKAVIDILADTNELQSDDVPGLIAALNDLSSADILTTALTEAYAADGAAMTLSEALYMIHSSLSEFAISGTTLTAKKLDGTTTAMTFTLDDASDPTSRTRAT